MAIGTIELLLYFDTLFIYVTLFIMIVNTLSDDLEIEQLYKKPERGDSHGYGLMRVREIVNRYPEMEHMTYKGVMFEGKEVLTQQIKIMCEMEGGNISV